MKYTSRDLELVEKLIALEARENFYAFRRYMRPKMVTNWFVEDFSFTLQRFYNSLILGRRPKLVIEAPPQHGKSTGAVEFVAWIIGRHPELKTFYCSFSERLGIRANLQLQRLLTSQRYLNVFPEIALGRVNSSQAGATRNRELLEFVGQDGYFRNTTVRGSITGESIDFGLIDDPVKGREAANSKTVRDSTWDWFTDDFMTRFADKAGLLIIMTRWHVDDLVGRLKEELGEHVVIRTYQAIATREEKHRSIGDPLLPELKSAEFLALQKRILTTKHGKGHYEALYQQNPVIEGGNLINTAWFKYYTKLPVLKYRMIYADTAQKKKEHNDYSVLSCWGLGEDNRLYLIDLVRARWSAPQLRREAIAFWNKHKADGGFISGRLRAFKVEDKVSGTGLIQEIEEEGGIPVIAVQRGTDKYTRFLDVQGYLEAGLVAVPAKASFLSDFLEECRAFAADDSHAFDDQVDNLMDAVDDMLGGETSIFDVV